MKDEIYDIEGEDLEDGENFGEDIEGEWTDQ